MKLKVVTALVGGLIIGLAGSAVFDGTGSTDSRTAPETEITAEPAAPVTPDQEMRETPKSEAVQQAEVQKAVSSAVKEANQMGGKAQAAVAAEGWDGIAQAGSAGTFRMWSTSKPIAAVALLEAQEEVDGTPAKITSEMRDAIVGSSNCGMRKLVLDLQRESGGLQVAAERFESVAIESGVTSDTLATAQSGPLEDSRCNAYLEKRATRTDADAWLFGTAEWTNSDAALFALALSSGRLGPAGNAVRGVMSLPKEVSPDEGGEDSVSTDLDWGAGKVFPAAWAPAYKSGWGGSQDGEYLASQLISLVVERQPVGISVAFSPDEQPPNDAVGQGIEDEAIEAMLTKIRDALEGRGTR